MTSRRHRARRAAGFTLVEMLIAIAVSAIVLVASLTALDMSFKQYKSTTESASTHVVSRIVVHRVLTMIRTGSEFGPFPADVLNPALNPVETDEFEFVSRRGAAGEILEITRIEFRESGEVGVPGSLWMVLQEPDDGGPVLIDERPLIGGVVNAAFTLLYDIGPRLRRATIDLTIAPDDTDDLAIGGLGAASSPRTIRLVASATPRQLQ